MVRNNTSHPPETAASNAATQANSSPIDFGYVPPATKPVIRQHFHKGQLIEQVDSTFNVGKQSFPSKEAAMSFIERSITHQS